MIYEPTRILTPADLDPEVTDAAHYDFGHLYGDMREEAYRALAGGSEDRVEVYAGPRVLLGPRHPWRDDVAETADTPEITMAYFPTAGRGAACTNGDSLWSDADGLDDLAARLEQYEAECAHELGLHPEYDPADHAARWSE